MNRNAISGWFPAPRQSCLRSSQFLKKMLIRLPIMLVAVLSFLGTGETIAQTVTCKDSADVAFSIASGSGSVTVPSTAFIESYSMMDSFKVAFVNGTLTGSVVVPCDSLGGEASQVFQIMLVGYSGGMGADTCTTYLKVLDETPAQFKSLPGDVSKTADAGKCYASGVALPVPKVTDGCLGEENMTFFERSDGLGETDSFLVGSTAVTFIYDDPHTDDTLFYSYNINVSGDAPVITNFQQVAIRDCDMNDTIDMSDYLPFGCTDSSQAVTIDAPYAVACDGDTIWGILPGALPSGVSYATNDGNTANPPTVTLSGSFNGSQLTWCFQNPPTGSTLCYETLTYVWSADTTSPQIVVPDDVTVYTAADVLPSQDTADNCIIENVDSIAFTWFNPATCDSSMCANGGVYPLTMAGCDSFFANTNLGGKFTDNCDADPTVEFLRDYYEGCDTFDLMNLPSPTSTDSFATALNDNPSELFDFGKGLHIITVRVTDMSGNSSTASFSVVVVDNEQPAWTPSASALADSLQGEILITENLVDTAIASDTVPDGGEIWVVLDCNDPNYKTDSTFLANAFKPTIIDECSGDSVMVDSAWTLQDTSGCPTFNQDGTDYFAHKATFTKMWSAQDDCGNRLDSGDGDMSGPDGNDDDRYVLRVRVVDNQGPRWDPLYDQDNDGIYSVASVPIAPVLCTAANDAYSGLSSSGTGTVYTCSADDTLKVYLSNFGITSAGDTCSLPSSALDSILVARAADCSADSMIVYTWSVSNASDCNGSAVTGIPANSTGTITDSVSAAGALTDWPAATYTITYTATDMCGLQSTYNFVFQIVDDLAPRFETCPTDISVNNLIGNCEAIAGWQPPTVADNCGGASIVSVEVTGPDGSTITTFGATSGSCTDALNFSGAYAAGSWTTTNNGGNGASDVSGAPANISLTSSTTTGVNTTFCINVADDGVISFDYAYGDSTDLADDHFGVSTDGASTIDWFLDSSTVSGAGSSGYSVVVANGDNFCFVIGSDGDTDSSTVTISNFSFQCSDNWRFGEFPVGVSNVKYIAEDACGDPANRDSCEFTVTVLDIQRPIASSTDTVRFNCDPSTCDRAFGSSFVESGSSDNCGIDSSRLEQTAGPGFVSSPYEGTTFTITDGPGTYNFNYIVFDSTGNSDTTVTVLVLSDVTAPEFEALPSTYTRYTSTDSCSYVETSSGLDQTAQDNCSPTVVTYHNYSVTGDAGYSGTNDSSSLSGAVFPIGATSVTWTTEDGSGNSATRIVTVNVSDTTDPVLTCPGNQIVGTSGSACAAPVNYNVTADDNCGIASIVSTPSNGSTFAVGATLVTSIALDNSGNSDTCSFTVTVVDSTVPVVLCTNINLSLNFLNEASITPQQIGSATDNCNVIDSVAISIDSFDCSNLGPNTVVYTAWDAAGNSASCNATVTVNDNYEDWAFSNCPADMELETAAGQCELNVTLTQPTVQAGCSSDSILPRIDGVVTRDDGLSINDPYPVGSTGVRWKFISPLTGDSVFCNYNVNIDDITAPTIYNCLDDQMGTDTIFRVMTDQAFCSQQQVFWDEPYALDACVDSFTLNTANRIRSAIPGTTFPSGCTTVSYRWEDDFDNVVICEFVICIEDTIRPELQCNASQVITRAMDECGVVNVPAIDFTSGGTDNCGIERRCIEVDLSDDGVDNPEVFCSPDSVLVLDCSNAPVRDTIPVRRWVEDPSGNTSDTCAGLFTVTDAIDPVLSLYDTALYTTLNAKDSCFATHTYTLPYVGCTITGDAPESDTNRVQGSAFYYDNDTCNTVVNIKAWQVADCDGAFNTPVLIDEMSFNAPEDVAYTYNFPVGRTQLIVTITDKFQSVTDTAYIAVADALPPFANNGPANVTLGTNQGQDSCYAYYEWQHPEILDNCIVDSVIMIVDYPDGAIQFDGSPLNDTSIVLLDGAQIGSESCPNLGGMGLLFPKLTTTVTYIAFDKCENCPFGLDGLSGWNCPDRNQGTVWTFDVVVNDSTPVVAFECPASTCSDIDLLPVYYLEGNNYGPGLKQPNSFPDSCECFGHFEYTVRFKENCDSLTIWKRVYVYENGQKVGMPLDTEMRVLTLDDRQGPELTYDFAIDDTLFKGDYYYEVVAQDCGGFRDTCSFELKVIDKQNPEVLDCPEPVTAYSLPGECSAEVLWDIPMNFDDNCKVIDSWSCSAEFEGQAIQVTSVDPEGCNSNVGFNGQWSPGFWEWFPNDPAFGSSSFYNHTSGFLFITDGKACVEVPHDGLISFRVADGTGTVAVAGSDIAITAGPGTGNDYTFTVRAGDTLCIEAPTMIEVTAFQFLCGGSQHNATFPVGLSTVTYVISDGMTYDSCGVEYGPNYDTCVVEIHVLDTVKPSVACIGSEIEVKLQSDGTGMFDVNDIVGTADDNCGLDSMWLSEYSLTCADTAGVEVTAYVRDHSGNISTCTTTVVAVPTSLPTPNSCPGSTLVYLDGNCEAVLNYDVPTVSLGCYGLDTMNLLTPGYHNGAVLTGEQIQSVNYEYTYMTSGGIMQTLACQFQVRVEDHIAPEFDLEVASQTVLSGDTVQLQTDGGYCFASIDWEVTNMVDNCDPSVQVTSSHSAGSYLPVGCTQVTVTATDDAGNASTRVFIVCVSDDEAPLLSCKDLTVQLGQDGKGSVDSLQPIGIIQDDCGITTQCDVTQEFSLRS